MAVPSVDDSSSDESEAIEEPSAADGGRSSAAAAGPAAAQARGSNVHLHVMTTTTTVAAAAAAAAAAKAAATKKNRRRWNWRKRQDTLEALQVWPTLTSQARGPYHEYVRALVEAGWTNLRELDMHMSRTPAPVALTEKRDGTGERSGLVISVLDITHDFQVRRHPDIHDDVGLRAFLNDDHDSNDGNDSNDNDSNDHDEYNEYKTGASTKHSDVRVRLFVTEQQGPLSGSLIETFGHALRLDPRFFQWQQRGSSSSRRFISPAERHRAPFINITFTVPKPMGRVAASTASSRVAIYVQPTGAEGQWTGLILCNSRTMLNVSVNAIYPPPPYSPTIPYTMQAKYDTIRPRTIRELYLQSFSNIDCTEAASSPFYTFSFLFRLSYWAWNQVIAGIRAEDSRVKNISETAINYREDIRKMYTLTERGGSLAWHRSNGVGETVVQTALLEDFEHLGNQAELMWEAREKMGEIQQRRSDSRYTLLTNSFTFIFVPISLVSSIYGMNVSEISGSTSNPNIWQFFLVVIALNVVIVLALAFSHYTRIWWRAEREARIKESFRFAVGLTRW